MNIETVKKVFMVGIGGSGMSALAQLLHAQGKEVSGSDANLSVQTEKFHERGIIVHVGHDSAHLLPDTELVIFSQAIPRENPELIKAEALGIPTVSYAVALGEVSRGKKTIAIAGTHGKTTTTALVTTVFKEAGYNPTAVIGGILKSEGSNFVRGQGEYLIVEADEYKKSFLFLAPLALVITNIDLDHLDFYKGLADIQNAFREFAEKVPPHGVIVCNPRDPHVSPILSGIQAQIVDYTEIEIGADELTLPGEHNRNNARAALAVAQFFGLDEKSVRESLGQFKGTGRRFDFIGMTQGGAHIYDDYAHNPPKVRAALAGLREKFPLKRITAIFQPHLYSRTKEFLDQFAASFENADFVIVTDIYAARESDDGSIHGKDLVEKIPKEKTPLYISSFAEISSHISSEAGENDVVVTIGAGDIYKVAESVIAH